MVEARVLCLVAPRQTIGVPCVVAPRAAPLDDLHFLHKVAGADALLVRSLVHVIKVLGVFLLTNPPPAEIGLAGRASSALQTLLGLLELTRRLHLHLHGNLHPLHLRALCHLLHLRSLHVCEGRHALQLLRAGLPGREGSRHAGAHATTHASQPDSRHRRRRRRTGRGQGPARSELLGCTHELVQLSGSACGPDCRARPCSLQSSRFPTS
mmetsp:Transcript_14517/g.36806  ORF Transcript_14517/g.36806 Transcript_14517/m.36806 type:complete len:210 (-) Transcript_14517:155-784(-)